MQVKLAKKRPETSNITTFWFEPPEPISYLAGQYIELTLSPELKHWFTLSSAPTDSPLVSITTRLRLDQSEFKRKLNDLMPGDSVEMSAPMGDFVLPKDESIPLLFVAGGIGITPFHSIIKWLSDTQQSRQITLLYAAHSETELLFQDLFSHYGLKRIWLVEEPTDKAWDGPTGRLDAKRILELGQPADDSLIYVSGPEPMVESLHKGLAELGISKDRLVGDYFPGYTTV